MTTPFHIFYKAKRLANYAFGRDRLIPAFASSNIAVFPYQVSGAMFALHNSIQKGVILCDEGGLGKSYVAMLAILAQWHAGKHRVLLAIPNHLKTQWQKLLDEKIDIPYQFIIDNSQFIIDEGLFICIYEKIYELCIMNYELPKWDIIMFDEAGRLHDKDGKETQTLRELAEGAFKILLTATPIQLNIMDLFGLMHFIDDTVLGDETEFYKTYFRKPENYPQLSERVKPYCYRTLREQAKQYAKIPNRNIITLEFEYSKAERELYNALDTYIKRPVKEAFPKMDKYDLALMLFKTFSSSHLAIKQTIEGVINRCDENGWAEMLELASTIKESSKAKALKQAIEVIFKDLKAKGANKKALIFVENKQTQKYLAEVLSKYKITTDYEKFADNEILITTDIASVGLNFEFCSFVVNYDLAFNTQKMEQRIARCHRIGQQNDVTVLNLINKTNFADVRALELVSKRTLVVDGIFGLTDNVVGGFTTTIDELQTHHKTEIEKEYQENLAKNETLNKQKVESAEELLFTTFTKEQAQGIHITPQYVESKVKEINDDIWDILKWFFAKHKEFLIDDETRTIRTFHNPPPTVFTGNALRRDEYSMFNKDLPKSGRITINSPIVQNVLKEIFWQGCYEGGSVTVDGNASDNLKFYEITVSNSYGFGGASYLDFIGDKNLLNLPVVSCQTRGLIIGQKDGFDYKYEEKTELDTNKYLQKYAIENSTAIAEEVAKVKAYIADKKAALHRAIAEAKRELKPTCEQDTMEQKLLYEKQKVVLQEDIKRREQNLFMDEMRLDVELEQKIAELTKGDNKVKVRKHFDIQITGGQANG